MILGVLLFVVVVVVMMRPSCLRVLVVVVVALFVEFHGKEHPGGFRVISGYL